IRQLATAGTLALLPPGPRGVWGISFTPDGSSVYYAIYTAETPTHALYQIPALGGTPRQLLIGIDSHPIFSPDGKRIAFVRGEFPSPGASSLMVADTDGSHQRTVATRRAPEFFYPIFFTAPAWSTDGRVIVVPMERRKDKVEGPFLAVNE